MLRSGFILRPGKSEISDIILFHDLLTTVLYYRNTVQYLSVDGMQVRPEKRIISVVFQKTISTQKRLFWTEIVLLTKNLLKSNPFLGHKNLFFSTAISEVKG